MIKSFFIGAREWSMTGFFLKKKIALENERLMGLVLVLIETD